MGIPCQEPVHELAVLHSLWHVFFWLDNHCQSLSLIGLHQELAVALLDQMRLLVGKSGRYLFLLTIHKISLICLK